MPAVGSEIRPGSSDFPGMDEKYLKGGYRTVANIADLSDLTAIPASVRKEGMQVKVLEDGKTYELDADLETWSLSKFDKLYSYADAEIDKALILTTPDGEHTVVDVDKADGQVNFHPKVTVPDGNWPYESLADDVKARLPFETDETRLLTAFALVATGPDGREYVSLEVPTNVGSAGIAARVTNADVAGNAGDVPTNLTDIIAVGDSMTAAGSGIIDVLPSRFPTRNVVACAEGGERTDGIAVSFGVPDLLTLAITGNAIPTNGTVTVTPNILFLAAGLTSRVTVRSETGAAIECFVYNSGGTYYLRPKTYPAAAIRVQNPARARVISFQASGTDPSATADLDPWYDATAIFRAGRNDCGYNKSYDGEVLVDLIARMAALMRSGRYIVLGSTTGLSDVPTAFGGVGTQTEAQGAQSLQNIMDFNSRLAAAFPDAYESPNENYRALGCTTEFTLNGTTYTVNDSTVLVPDGTHENLTGKGYTCDLIEDGVAARSY